MIDNPAIATLRRILAEVETNPDLRRELQQWIRQLLHDNEDLRESLRREILGEEILLLPVRFTHIEQVQAHILERLEKIETDVATLTTNVATLTTDVAELKTNVATLTTRFDRLDARVDDMDTRMGRMSGQLANLTGADYEARVVRQARRLVRRFMGMARSSLLFASRTPSEDFQSEVLDPAIDAGRITQDDAEDIEQVDCIVALNDPVKGMQYAAVEVSVTVKDEDRVRAARRAAIFSRITGVSAQGFVIGQEDASANGISHGVTFIEHIEYEANPQ